MALTERLQILLEATGGSAVVGEFRKVGDAATSDFGRVSTAGQKAAKDLETAQQRMGQAAAQGQAKIAAETQKMEAAQLKAAQSAAVLERAQAKVADTAPGTLAAARAQEQLEQAELKASHAAQSLATAQGRVDNATEAAGRSMRAAERDVARLGDEVTELGRRSSTAEQQIERVGVQSSVASKVIGAGMAAAAALGARELVRFGKAAIDMASDLAESTSKTKVVFGDASAAVMKFGDQAAKSLGLSKQEALEASATFGNLFRGMKFGQEESANLSKEVVTLAADLASFNNLNISDVLNDLRSGLVGEAEPLRKYGVLLNEAAVQAEAARLGLGGMGRELTEQEKVQARYSLILAGTTAAQGDFARTSDGLANQQRILAAQARDFAAALGSELVPIVAQGVGVLSAMLSVAQKLHLPVGELIALAAGATLASKAVQSLTNRFVAQAVAASGAATASAAAARANTTLATTSAAVGAASAGAVAGTGAAAAATIGLGAAAKTVVPSLIGLYAAVKAGTVSGNALSDTFREKFLPGIIELERRLPIVGKWLADSDEKHYKLGASATKAADATVEMAKAQLEEKVQAAAVAKELERLEGKKESLTSAAKKLVTTTQTGVTALEDLGDQAGAVASKLDEMKDKAADLTTKLDRLFGATVNEEEAASSFEAAIDDLTEKMTENGRSLDVHTAKGRENLDAIRGAAKGLRDHIDAMVANGATQDQLRATFDRHIEDFRRVLRQMGLNEGEIDNLVTKYGLVPDYIDTQVQLLNVNEAIAAAERAANEIAAKFRIAHEAAKIVVEVFGVENAQNAINALKEEAGNIFVGTTSPEQYGPPAPSGPEVLHAAAGARIPAFAAAGMLPARATFGFKTSGPRAIVGEGNPAWPEYVIATDPQYRARNRGLWEAAGRRLGPAGGSRSSAGWGAPTIINDITVTPSPAESASPMAIAKAIAWELT